MDRYSDETLAVSQLGARGQPEWVQHVLILLDTAVRQLRHEQGALCTILKAVSLLRKQIEPPSAAKTPDAGGRLLAWQAHKVREYIDAHITDRLPVAELGTLVRQSQTHFSRTFRRTFGEPPHAFVIRRRLEFAADYMVQTDASLSTIALGCGFADQPHFCRAFRRATGLSPAVWRRMHNRGDNLATPGTENLRQKRRVAWPPSQSADRVEFVA
jgi:AraC family transcriptional regulator